MVFEMPSSFVLFVSMCFLSLAGGVTVACGAVSAVGEGPVYFSSSC